MKAIILSMHGIIYDSTPYVKQSMNNYLKEHGIEVDDKDSVLGRSLRDFIKFMEEKHNIKLEWDDFSNELRKGTLKLMKGKIQPNEGILELFKELRSKGIKIGIATQTMNAFAKEDLELMNLDQYVDTITAVDNITHTKPDPEILLTTAKNLGINPSECIFIEDSPVGIETSKNAGMKCIILRTARGGDSFPGVNLVINSIKELDFSTLNLL